ncbi:hypothetical protein [Paenibacillus alkalitolerans]|uniref:hypothetical protein n=1 Tax=Paenibacillus alkalitolerans TaxID=2799335 RepID=UPI0018F56C24|nr:hypothetical protein [Paenibacillus alkalitolerans]
MSQLLNLGNLFQRPLVPIGKNDQNELKQIYPRKDGIAQAFTHWLIALWWSEGEWSAGWKVTVFPVSEERVFWSVPPLFHTTAPSSFDNAWKLSQAILTSSRKDQLTDAFVHPYWDDWDKL